MHDCASILYSINIAQGIYFFPRFSAWCIPSLHPQSFNGMIYALVPYGSRIPMHSDTHAYMRICVGLCLDHVLVQ